MSRLSRTDAAKSTIAVWRWLNSHPSAPRIEGNAPDLLAALPAEIGDVPRSSQNGMNDRLRLMEHLGLITRESRHEYEQGEEHTFPKLHTITVLTVPVEEGAKKIARHFAQGGFLKLAAKGNQKNGVETAVAPPDPEQVVIRTDAEDRPVEAVVGPDAPNPFEALRSLRKSEPGALIEAARQYGHRQDFVFERLDEMEKLGVKIDREVIMRGIDLGRDDELEGISKILPFIDELEARVKQAQQWRDETISLRNELKAARDAKNKAEADLARQVDANKRLADRTAQMVARSPQVLVG